MDNELPASVKKLEEILCRGVVTDQHVDQLLDEECSVMKTTVSEGMLDDTSRLHEALQDQHCGHAIHGLGSLL